MKTIAKLRAEEPVRSTVPQPDSVEKIVKQLSLLSYRSHTYWDGGKSPGVLFDKPVRVVKVDRSMFSTFTCKPGCSACCLKFTLDYLPSEISIIPNPTGFVPRTIYVDGHERVIYTNDQSGNRICDFLTVPRDDGLGCGQWPHAPLSCASAPQFQVRQFPEEPGVTYILKGPYKNAENMTPEPQCQFSATVPYSPEEDSKLVERFTNWADHLGISTCLDYVQDALWLKQAGVVWEA